MPRAHAITENSCLDRVSTAGARPAATADAVHTERNPGMKT
ncbi:hypothetical protein A7982_12677 [Minicystis rosea]|nr:hypothetical protein A7982_12677 [Minicystis rosea]